MPTISTKQGVVRKAATKQDEPTANLFTVRCWDEEREFLRQAAAKEHMSLPEWAMHELLPIAEKVLGQGRPDLPSMNRRKSRSEHERVVAEAARLVGITKEELRRRAEEKFAALILEESRAPSSFTQSEPPSRPGRIGTRR